MVQSYGLSSASLDPEVSLDVQSEAQLHDWPGPSDTRLFLQYEVTPFSTGVKPPDENAGANDKLKLTPALDRLMKGAHAEHRPNSGLLVFQMHGNISKLRLRILRLKRGVKGYSACDMMVKFS